MYHLHRVSCQRSEGIARVYRQTISCHRLYTTDVAHSQLRVCCVYMWNLCYLGKYINFTITHKVSLSFSQQNICTHKYINLHIRAVVVAYTFWLYYNNNTTFCVRKCIRLGFLYVCCVACVLLCSHINRIFIVYNMQYCFPSRLFQ